MEYRKRYRGFIIWLIIYCAACFIGLILPIEDAQIIVAITDNVMIIGVFVLTLMIYLNENIYWYNAITFEAALAAGSPRRKAYALAHVKRFGIFAGEFLIYSVLSIALGFPMILDIIIAMVGLVAVANGNTGPFSFFPNIHQVLR